MNSENIAAIEKNYPPLEAHHVTPQKLARIRLYLILFYTLTPLGLISLIAMMSYDSLDGREIGVLPAFLAVLLIIVPMGFVLYVALNPIFKRLMKLNIELDEGEIDLQRRAYQYAYHKIFKLTPLLVLPNILGVQMVNMFFPQGIKIELSIVIIYFVLGFVLVLLAILMLPMVYLARHMQPIDDIE